VEASFNHFFKAALTQDSPVNPNGLAPKAGDPLSFNPETSGLLGVEYRRPLGAGLSGFVRGEWSYVGRRFTGFRPFLNTGAVNTIYNNLPPYQLFNARFGVNTGAWRATVFVDNMFDARPIMQQQNYPGSITTRVTAKPRTFGATITRTF
jgi:hypothetical protein